MLLIVLPSTPIASECEGCFVNGGGMNTVCSAAQGSLSHFLRDAVVSVAGKINTSIS